MSRNKFTKAEDAFLSSLVEKYGTEHWELITAQFPNRNQRQCRERWIEYLSPEINRTPWTQEEDQKLLQLVETMGKTWVKISTFFDKRTDSMVKNRFLVLKRKEARNIRFYAISSIPSLTDEIMKQQKQKEVVEFAEIEQPILIQHQIDDYSFSENVFDLIDDPAMSWYDPQDEYTTNWLIE